jgi:hypothetical protein
VAAPVRLGGPPGPAEAGHRPGSGRVAVVGAGLAILFAIVAYVLYELQFSGVAQWIFGVVFLGGLTLFAAAAVARRTRASEPFAELSRSGGVLDGELASLAATIGRAERGMAFSREIVAARLRDTVQERVRVVRGLSPEAMRALEADAVGLRGALRDDVLADFLVATRTREGLLAWATARDRERLGDAVRRVVDRLEAWR